MIPILRYLSMGVFLIFSNVHEYPTNPHKFIRAISWHHSRKFVLSEVSESLVGFGHAVRFVALLHGGAGLVGSIKELVGQFFGHPLALAMAAGVPDPAHRQDLAALPRNRHRHLIVGTAHAARLQLKERRHILDSLFESIQTAFLGPFVDDVESIIDDSFSDAFLAFPHDHPDEMTHQRIAIQGIRFPFSDELSFASWHSL